MRRTPPARGVERRNVALARAAGPRDRSALVHAACHLASVRPNLSDRVPARADAFTSMTTSAALRSAPRMSSGLRLGKTLRIACALMPLPAISRMVPIGTGRSAGMAGGFGLGSDMRDLRAGGSIGAGRLSARRAVRAGDDGASSARGRDRARATLPPKKSFQLQRQDVQD